MGLSAWNAYRARKAAEEKVLKANVSTSPVADGVEVETETTALDTLEEVKPKKKKK